MTIEELNNFCINSFVDHLGIFFTDFQGNRISGEVEIGSQHLQPLGVVHGGVYLSIAETLAGAGSALIIEKQGKIAYGSTVTSQHIASVTSGKLLATGDLIHEGIFKHIWDIKITDGSGKLISISRVTNSIKVLNPESE